jgi:hypothetical protein
MNNEKNEKMIELAEWFVGITGIIYVTGFLVAMAFADYMGAREVISEFLRAKYLQVGILGVALPVIVVGAVFGIVELKSPGMMPVGAKLHGSSIILIFNLLFAFYTFLLFSPTGFLRTSPHLIWTIFGVTFAGLLAIPLIEKIIVEQHRAKFDSVARWILCALIVIGLDSYCLSGIASRLWETYCVHGKTFLLLVASMAFIVARVKSRVETYEKPRAKAALLIMTLCICGPLYFLTVLTFAYTIYPNIPANRGGGDYTETPAIVVYYDGRFTNAVPTEINRSGVSQPLVLIEESEKWLLVADPQDGGGPKAWRDGDGKPQIYSINRDSVVSFIYQSRKLPEAEVQK